jgi:type IV pilus assembly protein PilO
MEIEEKLQGAAREQRRLDQDLTEKQAIANNLNEYRRERDQLDQRLREALAELPDDKRIDELLQALQERAVKAGLDILTIEPQPQVNEGFYARIPVPMTVEGDYHEVATFLDSIGRLQRIVNVNNLSFDQPRDQNGRVVLSAKFLATTFMFVEAKDAKPGAPVAAGGAK